MRHITIFALITLLAAFGCGGSHTPESDDVDAAAHEGMPDDDVHAMTEGMPDDDVHASAMGQAMGGGMHAGSGINAEITLDPEIADDWKAVKVRVVELATMAETFHEIAIGESGPLGDSGLTLEVVAFVPDFVMSEAGITSRSAEPQNPAARIVISEEGKDDHVGWLFGAMPEIHAFPHESYGVMLVEGVPAE
jgi:hypothetical protein